MRAETDVLRGALTALGADAAAAPVVLADHPGRRRVERVGDIVVKAFAPSDHAAWRRELAGLRATARSSLAPPLVDAQPLWTATRWVDGVDAATAAFDLIAIHRMLGTSLARLHAVEPAGMSTWSVVNRLRQRVSAPPPACPETLVRTLARTVEPWTALVPNGSRSFVHGDWGTSNVVLDGAGSPEILAVVDFEDAHAGDPAEDFKWQVLAGPESPEYTAMSSAYADAGGSLGPNAAERLALAGVERCLDVLGWDLTDGHAAVVQQRCLQTLDALVSGRLPEPPPA